MYVRFGLCVLWLPHSTKMGDPDRVPVPPQRPDMGRSSTTDLLTLHSLLSSDEPMAGKHVMVPMTSQAFFSGRLEPPSRAGSGAKAEEESVLVNVGDGYLAQMGREEAAGHIQRRIGAILASVAQGGEGGAASEPSTASPSSAGAKNERKRQPPAPRGPALIEIREEFDAQGREVSAGVVNVADEMRLLKNAMRKAQGGDGSASSSPGGQEIHDLIETLDIGQVEGNAGPVADGADYEEESAPVRAEVSDEQYRNISSKLEALARAEEQAETNRKEGLTSRQRLQSKGWNKGFLEGGPTPARRKKKAAATKAGSSDGGWKEGFLNAEPKKKTHAAGAVRERSAESGGDGRQRKVVFGENETKNIPRIGQKSVRAVRSAELAQPPLQPQPPQQASRPMQPVSMGAVRERPIGASANPSQPTGDSQQQPPKRPSRFAQQRLQQRGAL